MVALGVTEGSLMKVVMMRWWGTLIRQKTHNTITHISHKLLYILILFRSSLKLEYWNQWIRCRLYGRIWTEISNSRTRDVPLSGRGRIHSESSIWNNHRNEISKFWFIFLLFISSLYIFMVSHANLNLFEVYHLIKIKIPKNVFDYRDFLTKMIEILLMFQGILSKSLRTSWSVRIWKRLQKNVWDTLHNTGNFLSY